MAKLTSPATVTPLLAGVWQRNQPLMLERLALLDRAAAAPSNYALRQEAISIAHKMAGSLGMFGFPRGTEIARELEVGLEGGSITPADQARLVESLRATLFPPDGSANTPGRA